MSRLLAFLISLALIALTLLLGVPFSRDLSGSISGMPLIVALALGVIAFSWLSTGPGVRKAKHRSRSISELDRRLRMQRFFVTFLVVFAAGTATAIHYLIAYSLIYTGAHVYANASLSYPVVLFSDLPSQGMTVLSILTLVVFVLVSVGATITAIERSRCPHCHEIFAMEVSDRQPVSDEWTKTTYDTKTSDDGRIKHITTVSRYQKIKEWRCCKRCGFRDGPYTKEEFLGSHSTER